MNGGNCGRVDGNRCQFALDTARVSALMAFGSDIQSNTRKKVQQVTWKLMAWRRIALVHTVTMPSRDSSVSDQQFRLSEGNSRVTKTEAEIISPKPFARASRN